jgi:transcriptional regulator GlxA family with amidase domain
LRIKGALTPFTLHRARSLLQNSRMAIEQVAAAVGYRDPTALRRLMRKVAGATPSAYRGSAAVSGLNQRGQVHLLTRDK